MVSRMVSVFPGGEVSGRISGLLPGEDYWIEPAAGEPGTPILYRSSDVRTCLALPALYSHREDIVCLHVHSCSEYANAPY